MQVLIGDRKDGRCCSAAVRLSSARAICSAPKLNAECLPVLGGNWRLVLSARNAAGDAIPGDVSLQLFAPLSTSFVFFPTPLCPSFPSSHKQLFESLCVLSLIFKPVFSFLSDKGFFFNYICLFFFTLWLTSLFCVVSFLFSFSVSVSKQLLYSRSSLLPLSVCACLCMQKLTREHLCARCV